MNYTLLQGNNLDLLRSLPDNSVDSIVTDPPYGLGKEPDALAMLRDWMEHGHHEVKSKKGFMGKEWDNFVPQPAQWKECLRVLKPGGHVLAFAGTRTQDLMALGLRIAGFEIRDLVAWIYGSGFPKSLDVSKAIDKDAGAERKVVSTGKAVKRMVPGTDQDKKGWVKDNGREFVPTITEAGTVEVAEWQGWGTALKPALEPITLARKPFQDTVVANVLKWHTGALNIDGCRVETTGEKLGGGAEKDIQSDKPEGWDRPWRNDPVAQKAHAERIRENVVKAESLGRWPANIITDGSDEVLALFPDTGKSTGGGMKRDGQNNNVYGKHCGHEQVKDVGFGDSGSAARFFYCAKTNSTDRNEGCESLPDKSWKGENTCIPERENRPFNPSKNDHPTVKPTALMRYLCRLVTPPGGTVLDPWMGSGSTGKACGAEGFSFIGMEMEKAYFTIAQARISAAYPNDDFC